jgi:glycosyltransferase involved in cell wall biosynthesis
MSLTTLSPDAVPTLVVVPQAVMPSPLDASLKQLDQAAALVDQAARIDQPAGGEQAVSTFAASDCDLSVVIPVYNEPKTVLEIVERVRRLAISKQIIVVNDGSTDETPQALEQLARFKEVRVVHHPVNAGKGAALQTGFRLATGRFVIVQDADLEYDPSDILSVIEPLQNGSADVVYGSRYLERGDQDPSRLHRLGNWCLTTFSNLMTGYRLTDMETCYKAFRRELLSQIEIEQKRFGFEPEITAKLAKRKVRIAEVPVRYESRGWEEGKKIGIKDLFSTLFCILRYSLKR